jgi:hypothetical protein
MTSPTHLTRDGIGDAGLKWAQSKQFLDTDGDGLHIPPGSLHLPSPRAGLVPTCLSAVSEAPRAKSWELRWCLGALQIQRLEGSRPGGTMGFVSG